MIESRRLIHISDLAEFVESRRTLQPAIQAHAQAPARKGRPPNSEKFKESGRT